MRTFKKFRRVYDQHKERDGEPFDLIREVTDKTDPDAFDPAEYTGPLYLIRFRDGTSIMAWPEEIAPVINGDDVEWLCAEYGETA